MSENTEPTLAAAERLGTSMDDLAGEMKALRQYGQQTRRITWGLAASIALDLVLSIALGIVAVQAASASERATEATSAAARTRENARITCEAGNESRRLQVQLWTYVLDLSSRNPANQTPEQKQRIAEFREYIFRVFVPRDCDGTVPTPQQPTTPPASR